MEIQREPERQQPLIPMSPLPAIIEGDDQPQERPTTPEPASRRPARRENLDRLFLYRRGELNWDQMTAFRGGPRRQGHQLQFWSWLAVVIDGLVLTSISCTFLVAFTLIVRSPIGEVLRFSQGAGIASLFIATFISFSWLYMVATRALFGFSMGEWACDLRLGQPTERMKKGYFFKVLLRSTLILVTGFVVLPLISFLSGRDVAGQLSGIRLISLK